MMFGEFVRSKRHERKLTLRDVAEQLGVSIPYLSDVERGLRGPLSGSHLGTLAKALDLPLWELEVAASVHRGVIELETGEETGLRHKAAVSLARAWRGLSEGQLRRIMELTLEGEAL